MKIHEFKSLVVQDLGNFRAAWLLKHKENPEDYPLDGLREAEWFERFVFFVEQGVM